MFTEVLPSFFNPYFLIRSSLIPTAAPRQHYQSIIPMSPSGPPGSKTDESIFVDAILKIFVFQTTFSFSASSLCPAAVCLSVCLSLSASLMASQCETSQSDVLSAPLIRYYLTVTQRKCNQFMIL